MATNGAQDVVTRNQTETKLKYLDFVYLAALKATALVTSLYEFAKESSGPLRPGVESVEGTVKKVLSPVYRRIEAKPLIVLHYFDNKVDKALTVLDNHLPQNGKEKLYKVYITLLDAPNVAKSLMMEVQKQGVYETTKNYYVKYEPLAEDFSYSAWKNLLKLPGIPIVVNILALPIVICTSRFNDASALLKHNKVPLASYIPVLPVEKIERALKIKAD